MSLGHMANGGNETVGQVSVSSISLNEPDPRGQTGDSTASNQMNLQQNHLQYSKGVANGRAGLANGKKRSLHTDIEMNNFD